MSFTRPGSILVSTAPETGKLDFLVRAMPPLPGAADDRNPELMKPNEVPPGPWDPGLLKDDDGRWYLYWGSSNYFPIYGMEIEWRDGKLIYKDAAATKLFNLDPDKHGWERFGQDHSGLLANGQPTDPYVEGAWVNKVGGRYYLQYGAPGTEFNAYANGTYVSDKPLGPFKYADYNPIAYKPGGFVEGAGHGSTFQDEYGNWWNTGTPWIGYNWTFERRINMFPTKFEADGQMHASSRFGDFPQYVPRSKGQDIDSLFTGWMLLSYRKAASASSTMGEFAADRVTDEDPRTFWVASANKPGETLTVDLGAREDRPRAPGQFRRLQVRTVCRRTGYLHRVRASGVARRPKLAAIGANRGAAPRPAQCLFRIAPPGHAPASSVTSTAMSARRTSRSAIFASSAMPPGNRRRRRRVFKECDIKTSATRRSVGRKCRARSVTTFASASGPTG